MSDADIQAVRAAVREEIAAALNERETARRDRAKAFWLGVRRALLAIVGVVDASVGVEGKK